MKYCLLLFIILTSFIDRSLANPDIEAQFANIRANPPLLRIFLQSFPKGADLHMHLSGAMAAEDMIAMASEHGFYLDKGNEGLVNHKCANCLPVKDISNNYTQYFHVVNEWSLRGADSTDWVDNHLKFFNLFTKYHLLSGYWGEMLIDLNRAAKKQNIQYLEIMFMPDATAILNLAQANNYTIEHSYLYLKYLEQQGLGKIIENVNKEVNEAFDIYNAEAGGNQTLIRLQYSVMRDVSLNDLFAQLAVAFSVANTNPYVVGVNIVQAEDDPTTIDDYAQQMQIIGYFRILFPSVHVSVHAGELWQGAVPLQLIGNHVREAMLIAKPDRIGHATDIAFEAKPLETLRLMRQKNIPVEVNLTSNHLLLGVPYKEHPIQLFMKLENPFVLATDDPGILRTNLTNEYFIATTQYHMNYAELVKLARNSLEYAFLPGKSLWSSPDYSKYVPSCNGMEARDKPNMVCEQYLDSNLKAKEQWIFENKLKSFEHAWFNN